MKLAIREHGGDFEVWAMLDDQDFNGEPENRGESFIIGVAPTLDAACEAAHEDLSQAMQQLFDLQVKART